jgi:hypothetical protein
VWNREVPRGVEASMRRLVWGLALVALIAACGSSGRISAPGSTSSTRGGDVTSTSLPTQPPRVLRGVPVRSFDCSQPVVSSGAGPVPIEAAQAFLLCPLGTPGQQSNAVAIGPNDPVFDALVAALSAADVPPTSGAVCPAYADLTQVVLAKTTSRVYQVSIPIDGCMHYQRDALDALRRARGA